MHIGVFSQTGKAGYELYPLSFLLIFTEQDKVKKFQDSFLLLYTGQEKEKKNCKKYLFVNEVSVIVL